MSPHHYVILYCAFKTTSRMFIGFGLILGMLGFQGLPVRAGDQESARSPLEVLEITPSLFGVDMYQIKPNYGFVEMAEAGAYWVRPRGVYWSEVQPVEDRPPDWSVLAGLEEELLNAADQGFQVIMLIRGTPTWAQAIPGVSCGPIAEDNLDDFADFMYQLVSRYKDQVKYWELWNEPDIDPDLVSPDSPYGCWGDEEDDFYGGGYYAQMLQLTYERIKEADPEAQVLVGGLVLDCDPLNVCPQAKSAKFLEGILQHSGGEFFDGISFHAFDYYLGSLGQYSNTNWNNSWDTTGPIGAVKASYLRSVLVNAGLTNKYLLNTEASVFCDDRYYVCEDIYEATKANYVAQSYGSAFAPLLLSNLWFSSRAGYRNTDLLGDGLAPLPAYTAYQFAQSLLHQAEYIGNVKQYPGVKGFEFRLDDCPVPGETCRLWQIWSLDGNDHLIELPGLPYAVYGVDGEEIDPTLQQTINLEPLYIKLPPEFRVRLPTVPQEYSLLQNGDFEAGAGAQGQPVGWVAFSGGQQGLPSSLVSSNPTYPEADADIPAGDYSMLLGNPNYPCSSTGVPLGYAAIEQIFNVPHVPDGTELNLVFNYVIYTQDGGSSGAYDRFDIYIDDGNGPVLGFADGRAEQTVSCASWYRLPESGWQEGSIDLTNPVDYRGKPIKISFQNWSRYDHWYNTFTYVDNVKLVVGQ